MQQTAWYLSVLLVAALSVAFLVVALKSGKRDEEEGLPAKAYRYRAPAFWALVVAGVGIAAVTLVNLPYAAQRATATEAQVVTITGNQWYWDVSPEEVAAGQPVEFWVTSADVNHGFGLYDSSLRLLAQTQAMPGYVNRVRITFSEPGTYQILCLEYCGLAHHQMPAEIRVIAR